MTNEKAIADCQAAFWHAINQRTAAVTDAQGEMSTVFVMPTDADSLTPAGVLYWSKSLRQTFADYEAKRRGKRRKRAYEECLAQYLKVSATRNLYRKVSLNGKDKILLDKAANAHMSRHARDIERWHKEACEIRQATLNLYGFDIDCYGLLD